jgi:hypothetical protein
VCHEVAGESARQELLQGGSLRGYRRIGAGQQPPSPAVEPGDLGQHAEERTLQRPPGLREHAAGATRSRVLQPAALAPDGQAHLRILGCDVELAKQPKQVGVRPLVVDDEPGVDAQEVPGCSLNLVGVGMTAQTPGSFVERHPMATLQHVRRGQAGNAAAHHRNTALSGRHGVHPRAWESSRLRDRMGVGHHVVLVGAVLVIEVPTTGDEGQTRVTLAREDVVG